uniref:ATP synthase subunit 8 n=1 Tax=Porcellio dilatatus dilatatus TaxID=96810 RepID=A0A1P8DKG4_PORDI|nr:ATP synthase subunit 8 [Porcellio dilatatus dilatatus]
MKSIPQMSPLPWVMVWWSVLGLVLVYSMLIYFSMDISKKDNDKKVENFQHNWVW